MADFITNSGDSELLAESQNLFSTINPDPTQFGLTAAQATALQSAITALSTDSQAHIAAQADAKSKTQAKETSRDALERVLRELLGLIKKTTSVSEAQIASLGQFTSSSYTPLSNPTRPQGKVDTSQRLRHTVSFADEATPDQRRKPAGTVGCEIWGKIGGEAPTDEKECFFVALDTATPYVYEFGGADAGKMIHYMLRWSLRDGNRSPWGETISATVTG
jgi:hypothetical protein